MLVVHPSVPAQTIPEFVAWLRAQNGKVSCASSGTDQSPKGVIDKEGLQLDVN